MAQVVTEKERAAEVASREAFQEDMEHKKEVAAEAKMTVRVTRKLVLAGASHREMVPVPQLGEGAFLTMRPLVDNEFVQMQTTILRGIPTSRIQKLQTKTSSVDLIKRENEAKYQALALALSIDGQKWTPKDIGALPPGVPTALFNVLARISGFPTALQLQRRPRRRKPQ